MTCRGYDPKAIKISKAIKRLAATYIDDHKRGEFIRSYVRFLEEESRQRGARNKK
mgnify:FL=1